MSDGVQLPVALALFARKKSIPQAQADKNAAALSQTAAAQSAADALAAKNAAVAAQNNAVATVTGGTASLVAAEGKIPIADAAGALDPSWSIRPRSILRPAYVADFTLADAAPAEWVCNRASPALRVNAFGALELVPANTGRITYDPVTGECLGLLREPQTTNGFIGSEKFDALPGSDGTAVITRGLGYANPIGAAEVSVVTKAAGRDGTFQQYATRPTTPNTVNVWSYFIRPVSNIKALWGATSPADRWLFTYERSTKVLVVGVNAAWAEVQDLADGWLRITVAQKTPDTSTSMVCAVVAIPTTPADPAEFWTTGYQIHSGANPAPASYIKTDTAAVTRTADQLYTPLGAWFNRAGGEGALVIDMDVRAYGATTDSAYAGLQKSSALINSQDYGLTLYGGLSFLTRNPLSAAPGVGFVRGRSRIAIAANAAGKRLARNGGAVLAAAGAGLNDVSLAQVLTLGGGASSDATLLIRRVEYYPRAPSDADLTALSRI